MEHNQDTHMAAQSSTAAGGESGGSNLVPTASEIEAGEVKEDVEHRYQSDSEMTHADDERKNDATHASTGTASSASSSAAASSASQPDSTSQVSNPLSDTNTFTSASSTSAAAPASSSTSSHAQSLPVSSSSPIPRLDSSLLQSLDDLLFGPKDNCSDNDRNRWREQGFVFSSQPSTLFGLTQTAGGPCGVLAPVQAFILERLLFGGTGIQVGSSSSSSDNHDIPVAPTPSQQDEALVWALTHIIQRTEAKTFRLVTGSSHDALYLHQATKREEVAEFFTRHLPQLHGPLGVLTFVYSVLLSRGTDTIRSDMDDSTSYLVGAFGHSSQELVNLLLCGRAVTNVFDGTKVLGDPNDPTAWRLKGIQQQNEVGFLTLLEALRYSTVGEFYKSPKFPIWVIGSSNHYTCMFSLDRRVGQLTSSQKKHRSARTAFESLDPENNGFIPITQLPALMAQLDAAVLPPNTTMEDVKKRLDPDGLGLILFERLITVLEQWEKLKALTQAQAAIPQTPFSCQACTFNNVATATSCEICGTPRPPPPPAAKANNPEEMEVQNFTLYHFNGIEISGKSYCECHRVMVSVVEGGLPPQIQGDAISEGQGLKEILLTRWPSSIIDIDGVAKIS